MNTIWLKLAGVAVAVVIVLVVVGRFRSGNSTPAPAPQSEKTKTFDQMVERDKQYLQEPEPVEEPPVQSAAPVEPNKPQQEVAQAEGQPAPPAPSQTVQQPPSVIYVKPLGEIDKIEAERLFNVAVPGRSIGRLPMTGYKLMVDNCRQIIQRWPDSFYAYQCKRLMAELPERYQMRYSVTEQEKDISPFLKRRPGTQPVKVTEER
jgi:hypothetical protein